MAEGGDAHLTFTAVLWLRKNYLFAMFLEYKCSKLLKIAN